MDVRRKALANLGVAALAVAVLAAVVWSLMADRLEFADVLIFLAALILTPVLFVQFFRAPQLRLVIYVGGALLVMQSEAGLAAALKPLYMPAAAACIAVSLVNVRRLSPELKRAFRPAFIGGMLLFSVVALFVAGSALGGEEPSRVIRDALTYIMIAGAPFVGADAARHASPRRALVTTTIVTGVAALGFAVYWLSIRGASTLGVERLVMFSLLLTGLGLMLGLVYGLVRRNLLWLAFGVLCFIAVLVTGTRTGFVLILGMLGAVGFARNRRVPPVRLLFGGALAAVGTYFALPLVASRVTAEGFIEARIRAMTILLEGGVSNDHSGVIRQRALDTTLDLWDEHPFWGVGFGYAFPNPNPGAAPADFQLDSAALILAKFGLFGSLLIVVALLLMARTIWRFHKTTGIRSEAQTVGTAYTVMCLFLMPLASPMEDKGFALGFCLVFYLLGASRHVMPTRQRGKRPPRQLFLGVHHSRTPVKF